MTSVATKFDLDLWFETSRYSTQDSVFADFFLISCNLLNMIAFFQIKQKNRNPVYRNICVFFELRAPVQPLSWTKLGVNVVVKIVWTKHCNTLWRKCCQQLFWSEMGDVVFLGPRGPHGIPPLVRPLVSPLVRKKNWDHIYTGLYAPWIIWRLIKPA